MKAGETRLEVRSCTDVQIVCLIWSIAAKDSSNHLVRTFARDSRAEGALPLLCLLVGLSVWRHTWNGEGPTLEGDLTPW